MNKKSGLEAAFSFLVLKWKQVIAYADETLGDDFDSFNETGTFYDVLDEIEAWEEEIRLEEEEKEGVR